LISEAGELGKWRLRVGDALCLVHIVLIAVESVHSRVETLLQDVWLYNHFIVIPTLIDCFKELLFAIEDIVSTPTSSLVGLDSFEEEPWW
jgi:hypothetical protein